MVRELSGEALPPTALPLGPPGPSPSLSPFIAGCRLLQGRTCFLYFLCEVACQLHFLKQFHQHPLPLSFKKTLCVNQQHCISPLIWWRKNMDNHTDDIRRADVRLSGFFNTELFHFACLLLKTLEFSCNLPNVIWPISWLSEPQFLHEWIWDVPTFCWDACWKSCWKANKVGNSLVLFSKKLLCYQRLSYPIPKLRTAFTTGLWRTSCWK